MCDIFHKQTLIQSSQHLERNLETRLKDSDKKKKKAAWPCHSQLMRRRSGHLAQGVRHLPTWSASRPTYFYPSILPHRLREAAGDGVTNWVPPTHMEDSELPGPALAGPAQLMWIFRVKLWM